MDNYKDRKEHYQRHQHIYHCIDEKSKEELVRIRGVVKRKYENLFNRNGNIKTERAKKLERLYYIIDCRIGENLKLWR